MTLGHIMPRTERQSPLPAENDSAPRESKCGCNHCKREFLAMQRTTINCGFGAGAGFGAVPVPVPVHTIRGVRLLLLPRQVIPLLQCAVDRLLIRLQFQERHRHVHAILLVGGAFALTPAAAPPGPVLLRVRLARHLVSLRLGAHGQVFHGARHTEER